VGSDNTFQGKKRRERETDDLPLFNAEVRNIGTTLLSKKTLQNENQIRCYLQPTLCSEFASLETREDGSPLTKETGRTA